MKSIKDTTAARLLAAGLGVCLLFCSGCTAVLIGVGAAAGAGDYAYVKGELNSVQSVSLDRVWVAT